MKNFLVIILLAFITDIALCQQSEVREVGSFKGIKASEGVDVYLTKGDKESVTVEANTNLSNVITEISGTYLRIHMRENKFIRNLNVKVHVTYVQIDRISASSAASVYSRNTLKANDLTITSSSAASVELTVDAGDVEVSSSSAGEVELEGKARSASFDASSAGKIDAYDFEAEKVRAEASSAGSVKLYATRELDATASSGGDVRYRGNPSKSKTHSSSGGSVKKTS